MRVRDSGMPEEGAWSSFFDVESILGALAFPGGNANVVDFGSGYGTFALAAARATTGKVFAIDIDSELIRAVAARAVRSGLGNVHAVARDFLEEGTGLPDASMDYAMLFNILHAENPGVLLREALRVLRPGGKAAVIHWVQDAATPRGPDLSIRPRPEDCREWLEQAGLELLMAQVSLPPYHFGVVGRKA